MADGSEEAAARARRLAEEWTRLRVRGCYALGGCACAAPSTHISPALLEADLIAVLRAKHARNGAVSWVLAAERLADVFVRLGDEQALDTQIEPLLGDLEASLSSMRPRILQCR